VQLERNFINRLLDIGLASVNINNCPEEVTMKKFILAGLVLCGLFVAQHSYSDDSMSSSSSMNAPSGQVVAANQGQYMSNSSSDGAQYWSRDGRQWNTGSCGMEGCDEPREDHACGDTSTGDCWCKYCHYKPCYYYTKRCVTENKYCTKRCCRQVPQYYEVQRCKYVPQYYTETCCKYCPQYYDVQECVPCQKWVCDRHCKYVPCYYWKHVCGQENCTTPCPQ
jgi:hypothetical protein